MARLINIHVNKYSRSIYGHIWTYTDIFEHIRTCMDMYGLILTYMDLYFGCQPTTPWSMCLPQALFFLKNDAPGFVEHVYCKLVDFH